MQIKQNGNADLSLDEVKRQMALREKQRQFPVQLSLSIDLGCDCVFGSNFCADALQDMIPEDAGPEEPESFTVHDVRAEQAPVINEVETRPTTAPATSKAALTASPKLDRPMSSTGSSGGGHGSKTFFAGTTAKTEMTRQVNLAKLQARRYTALAQIIDHLYWRFETEPAFRLMRLQRAARAGSPRRSWYADPQSISIISLKSSQLLEYTFCFLNVYVIHTDPCLFRLVLLTPHHSPTSQSCCSSEESVRSRGL